MQTPAYTLRDIATHIGASIVNPSASDLELRVHSLAPLKTAKAGELTFLTNPQFAHQAANTAASAIIVKDQLTVSRPLVQLIHPNPAVAMALAAQLFYQPQHSFRGQSSLAYVDKTAELAADVTLYPFAYVGPGARLGQGCVVYPHAYIGENCNIGAHTVIYPGATLMADTSVGAHVIIHAGAVLGGDGFGFAPGSERIHKIPQVGRVVIEDEVEVGPLTTIDRATFHETRVRFSAKLDSHVHIGHNADIGELTMLCGQVGVAGSAKIGKRCIAAGQAGISQGVHMGDGVILGAKTALLQSEAQPGEYHGIPAIPSQQWRRQAVASKKLPELLKVVKKLEQRLAQLEEKLSST